jgi:hypothetical protein
MKDTIKPLERSWYKQFWPWFLISLPASVVVASMFTISIAIDNAPTITDREIGRFAREEVKAP